MDDIDRRQVLIAAASLAASTALPGIAAAASLDSGYEDRLDRARALLSALELHETSCGLYEAVAENFGHWNLLWEDSYTQLVQAADDLRRTITDDTPEMCAILAQARTILPPPCERAHTYWDRIPDLSRNFRKPYRRYYELRAQRLDDKGRPRDGKPFAKWNKAIFDIMWPAPKTPGDRELQRRALQSYGDDALLDLAHLRARGGDWKTRLPERFSTSCGALPCKECAQWLA